MTPSEERKVDGDLELLIVGWDSEYCEIAGEFYPISTQMYVLETACKYFIPHPGQLPSLERLIRILHRDHPDIQGFHLVAHLTDLCMSS